VNKISFDGVHYRRDIASKAITNPPMSIM
jgi:phosphoribosylamine-glycine ligase